MVKETQKTTFEQNMAAMGKMSPKEMDAKLAEFTKMCICGGCPTYAGTGEKRLLFCATGKSKIIKKRRAVSALAVLSRINWLFDGTITA